jgi:hypothetical protein
MIRENLSFLILYQVRIFQHRQSLNQFHRKCERPKLGGRRKTKLGRETRSFESEERNIRAVVSAFLTQRAAKILAGQFVLRQGQEMITLQLP